MNKLRMTFRRSLVTAATALPIMMSIPALAQEPLAPPAPASAQSAPVAAPADQGATTPTSDAASGASREAGQPAVATSQTGVMVPPGEAKSALPAGSIWWGLAAMAVLGAAVLFAYVRMRTPKRNKYATPHLGFQQPKAH